MSAWDLIPRSCPGKDCGTERAGGQGRLGSAAPRRRNATAAIRTKILYRAPGSVHLSPCPIHSNVLDCRRRQLLTCVARSLPSNFSLLRNSIYGCTRCKLCRQTTNLRPRHEPHERDTPNPCDIMSFPGMGGGLPGMPGGGGGNVDPNDPNAVQMVRGAPAAEQAVRPRGLWLPWSRSTLTWGVNSKKQ